MQPVIPEIQPEFGLEEMRMIPVEPSKIRVRFSKKQTQIEEITVDVPKSSFGKAPRLIEPQEGLKFDIQPMLSHVDTVQKPSSVSDFVKGLMKDISSRMFEPTPFVAEPLTPSMLIPEPVLLVFVPILSKSIKPFQPSSLFHRKNPEFKLSLDTHPSRKSSPISFMAGGTGLRSRNVASSLNKIDTMTLDEIKKFSQITRMTRSERNRILKRLGELEAQEESNKKKIEKLTIKLSEEDSPVI